MLLPPGYTLIQSVLVQRAGFGRLLQAFLVQALAPFFIHLKGSLSTLNLEYQI